jgi:hypothetical protein
MDHPSPAARRSAYLRVGGAAGAVFLVFLLIGIARGPAQAATPIVPAATSTPAPSSGALPGYRRHDRGGFGGGGEQTVPGDPGFAPGQGDEGPDQGDQGQLPGDPSFGPDPGGGQQPPPTTPSTGGAQS